MTSEGPRFGSSDPESRFIHWQIARQEALAELEERKREQGPNRSVLWFNQSDGKVYDRPEGGQEVHLRPAAMDGEQILYERTDEQGDRTDEQGDDDGVPADPPR